MENKLENEYDLIIVGAGPAGIAASVEDSIKTIRESTKIIKARESI